MRVYRCDRCGAEYQLPAGWPHTARKNQATANNHIYELCERCAGDLERWIEAGEVLGYLVDGKTYHPADVTIVRQATP
jgi:phage terminase large subunit GpA-like protein